jgi:hypothetical protein
VRNTEKEKHECFKTKSKPVYSDGIRELVDQWTKKTMKNRMSLCKKLATKYF